MNEEKQRIKGLLVFLLLLFVFGLMSEVMMKTYYGLHADSPYSIKDVVVTEEEEHPPGVPGCLKSIDEKRRNQEDTEG